MKKRGVSLIIDDISNLFCELSKTNTHKEIARHFDREKKFVNSMKSGCCFNLDYGFIAGLNHYGYELKLVKKD